MSHNVCKEKVYKDLFFTHSEYLRNFIYYKSKDIMVSEDIVQESFLKLWENCSQVTFEKAKSYLFTVANNMFLNKVKHNNIVLKFQNEPQKTEDTYDAHKMMEEKEFELRLKNAISNLPEKQRIVFLLSRIDKKKYHEIASDLDISVKAVEKRMHAALKSLRKIHQKI